ncbi:RNA-directed DNA polymerase, eukaryota, reverse transcriptase zinc-binding domain protein, partial [Tanacetum coccineum]
MEEGSEKEDINSILNKFFDMIKNMSDIGNCMQAATTPFAKISHMRPNDGVSSKDKHMEPLSYASLLNSKPRGKKENFRALDNTETVEGTDLAIPMANDQELKESLVVAILKLNEIGHTMEKIHIEYEWKPPRCDAYGVHLRGASTSHGINILDSDCDEVEHVFDGTGAYMELISSSKSTNLKGASTPVDVVSNSHVASSHLDKYTHRHDLWQDLGAHKAFLHGKSLCLLNDFNSVLNLEDHAFGTSLIDISIREFKEYVEDIEVLDVNKSGLPFTWNQKPKGDHGVLKKINQIMANLDFHDVFVGANALFQPYYIFDQSLAILRFLKRSKFHPKPFKFSNLLVFHGKFSDVVASSWETAVDGYDMFQVVKRLKALKILLGNCFKIREEASYLQAFNEALLDEERFLKQQSKVEQIRVGDSNSDYFHKVVESRVSRSRINRVLDMHGNCFEGNTAQEAFSNTEAAYMIHDVTNEDIKATIFSMGDDKSPGLDGYTVMFFKGAWEIVGVDISNEVWEFFVTGKLLKEVNHTIIALIPKIKIISNHIKDYLTDLVSINQSAFVPSRRISNNILLTQELMHKYHLDRGPS